jgi:hypothetical protein
MTQIHAWRVQMLAGPAPAGAGGGGMNAGLSPAAEGAGRVPWSSGISYQGWDRSHELLAAEAAAIAAIGPVSLRRNRATGVPRRTARHCQAISRLDGFHQLGNCVHHPREKSKPEKDQASHSERTRGFAVHRHRLRARCRTRTVTEPGARPARSAWTGT